MSLEKLDEIIRGMEETTKDFKRYKEVYGELENLQNKISAGINDLKANKESLDALNRDLNTSIENLRNKVEKLNNMIPKKMLELMTSNKDIQIDIKEKHEQLCEKMETYTKAVTIQSKRLLFVIIIAIITFIMNFIAIYPHLRTLF